MPYQTIELPAYTVTGIMFFLNQFLRASHILELHQNTLRGTVSSYSQLSDAAIICHPGHQAIILIFRVSIKHQHPSFKGEAVITNQQEQGACMLVCVLVMQGSVVWALRDFSVHLDHRGEGKGGEVKVGGGRLD